MNTSNAYPYDRDWDLIKLIFQEIKKSNDPGSITFDESIDEIKLFEHVLMLHESGLVDAAILNGSTHFVINRITMSGHDFYEKIVDDTMWEKIKAAAKEKSIGLSVETIGQLFTYCVKQIFKADD